ncbi:Alpha/Beta hydrolase protein [Aspergillus karnatakaensis]|uniref:Alpha/Beta hydrolase protein n=1 Tax=Aspergillus karnatakaensis TaxID=1810916 RepID=UPI003CCD731C
MTCEACRTIPPVISEGYTPKGTSTVIAGLDFSTYVTGPSTATTAILTIYDIFGNSPQTTQGADLLAARLNALVLIPDFFRGDGAKAEWFPTDTDERMALLMGFVESKASWTNAAENIPDLVEKYKSAFPSVRKWGAYGLCWGGKVLALSSGRDAVWGATVQVHPGLMDKADAEALTIPHAILASNEEPADVLEFYDEAIRSKGHGGFVETYQGMWHGWMGARADLKGKESLKEYVRGYEQLAEFFEKYLIE